MRYEKSERIQEESYHCPICFMADVLETMFDESNDFGLVHIIADDYTTEELIKLICKVEVGGWEFELQTIDFDKTIDDEFMITITNTGEVYVSPSTDDNGDYYECDGFIFADIDVDLDALNGNNRRCDAIIFEIEDMDYEINE